MILSNLIISASSKNVRVSIKKTNFILEKLRGKSYKEALYILEDTSQKPSDIIWETLYSVISNAVNNYKLSKAKLFIVKAYTTSGPILKRMRPRAKGRAFEIQKKVSTITISVSEKLS